MRGSNSAQEHLQKWVWVEGWGGQYGGRDLERVKATGPWPVEGPSQQGSIGFV